MATEIERKYQVKDYSWRTEADDGVDIRQAYMALTDKASIRIRIEDGKANINIKSATLDIVRSEYEYDIPLIDAKEMITSLCYGQIIKKRYHVRHDSHLWEIDVFEGDNKGLIVAEIELAHVDEKFSKPAWLGDEVSSDPRYYNVNLVTHPFNQW